MREIILLKCGELALKGLNRRNFEEVLMKNCRRRLQDLGEFKIHSSQSTIYVEPDREDYDLDEAVERLQKVSASPLSPAPAWWKRTSKSSNAPLPHI